MLKLPNVTIVSVNCKNPDESVKALLYSCKYIAFKEAILFTDSNISVSGIRTVNIAPINTIDAYSDFMLRLTDYLDTDYALIIQDDGFVLNFGQWTDVFLNYDFIGAPWPEEKSWIDCQQYKNYVNRVGNGGFSLRSRRFMELSSNFDTCEGLGEDVFLCNKNYQYMINNGIKFAPLEIAAGFSYENNLIDWKQREVLNPDNHFGFHGKNSSNHEQIISLKC